jgi:hypothetical protein
LAGSMSRPAMRQPATASTPAVLSFACDTWGPMLSQPRGSDAFAAA